MTVNFKICSILVLGPKYGNDEVFLIKN